MLKDIGLGLPDTEIERLWKLPLQEKLKIYARAEEWLASHFVMLQKINPGMFICINAHTLKADLHETFDQAVRSQAPLMGQHLLIQYLA